MRALRQTKSKQGKVWTKFGEPGSAHISLSKEEIGVTRFLYALVEKQEPIHLAERPGRACVAAADAFAEGPNWGIGGTHLITLRLSHVPGERNEWADCLSRELRISGLDPGKRVCLDWLALLNLGWQTVSNGA